MQTYITEAKSKGMSALVCSPIPHCRHIAASTATQPAALATAKDLSSYALWARQSSEAALITESGKQSYEFDVKVGAEAHEVKINAASVVIADSIEKPESDAKDKDGKD